MMRWIRRSFQNRIFASVLLVTLIPLLLCNVLMLQIQVRRSEEAQLADAREQLELFQTSLEQLCATADQVTRKLSGSTVVRSTLRGDTEESRILYQVLFRETQDLRQSAQVDIYLKNGVCGYTTAATLPAGQLDPDWGILYAASHAQGLAYRAGLGGDTAFQAARAVRSYDGGILGYLVVTVTQENLDTLFRADYAMSGELLVLDRAWELVYGSRPATAASAARELRSRILDTGALKGSGEYRYFLLQEPQTGYHLIFKQSPVFGAGVMRTFYSISIFTGVMSVVLCLLYSWWLSSFLSKPVHRMDRAMKRVREGDLSVRVELDREDELGRLAASFNRMTEEYQNNLVRSVQRQKELNDTQIRMMQAQLNPHFLYNTLDSMKWLGVTNHVPQIAELATDLATILRASISEEEFVTLEQELELIDRYLEIQYIRFADRFTCEIDIGEEFQHCLVPKLALEPLVENAIIHGVADQSDGYIKLTAREGAGALVLEVRDNGCGIPPEALEQINDPDKRLPGSHLGLYNVDRIAKLHFGPGYGVHAESVSGVGSCVSLRIPLNRKEETDAESVDRG